MPMDFVEYCGNKETEHYLKMKNLDHQETPVTVHIKLHYKEL